MSDATPITAAMLAEWRATTEAMPAPPWVVANQGGLREMLTANGDDGVIELLESCAGLPPDEAAELIEFIAAAREAMPLLIAEVERLRDRNEELSEAFDEVVAESNSAVQVAREGRDAAHAMAAERVQTEMARLRAELARERAGVRQRDAAIMELRTELERSKTQ